MRVVVLLTDQRLGESVTTSEATGSVEELRLILAARQQTVSYDEASEIADALVEFHEILAEEVGDESAV